MKSVNLTDAEVSFLMGILLDPSLDICQHCKFKPKSNEDCEQGFCDRLIIKMSKSTTRKVHKK